ncbi:MAG: thermonuclease family protein [Acidimicrobiia bacterium]
MRNRAAWALPLVAAVVAAACAGSSSEGEPVGTPAPGGMPAGDDTTVERHVDGDTLWVDDRVKVRLIGIDTPETQHPSRTVECFGEEASAFLAELLPLGTDVRLVYDVEPEDRYGRTLAYVYRAQDGLFVNAELVRDGYAQVYTAPPNVTHVERFLALQTEARQARRGLWSACDDLEVPKATPRELGGCDASYPDMCVPSPPPDLDCRDISERRFRVEGGDPHHFDGDRNGLGCEQPSQWRRRGSRQSSP